MEVKHIGVLGNRKVGKSTLIQGYTAGLGENPPGASIHPIPTKLVTYRRQNFVLMFEEHGLEEAHNHAFDALMIVFDLSSQETYDDCTKALMSVKKPCILLGNKVDLETRRQVLRGTAVHRARKGNYTYAECSALLGDHMDACLFMLLDVILDSHSGGISRFCTFTRVSRKRLLCLCIVVSVLTMLQGLAVLMYGAYFAAHLDISDVDWVSDALMISGLMTFIISFLGFYGSKSYGIKEYLKVYAVLSALEAFAKLVVLLVIVCSVGSQNPLYEKVGETSGFMEILSVCLALEAVASGLAFASMKSVSMEIDHSSYFELYVAPEEFN